MVKWRWKWGKRNGLRWNHSHIEEQNERDNDESDDGQEQKRISH